MEGQERGGDPGRVEEAGVGEAGGGESVDGDGGEGDGAGCRLKWMNG